MYLDPIVDVRVPILYLVIQVIGLAGRGHPTSHCCGIAKSGRAHPNIARASIDAGNGRA